MRVTDEDAESFRQLYLAHQGEALSLDDAREMLARLLFLYERFAAWVAKEEAAGRSFEIDEPSPVPQGSERIG
jgi:hypothetical protein